MKYFTIIMVGQKARPLTFATDEILVELDEILIE